MTTEEHQLQILMFARVFEAMTAISEAMKRAEIWDDDDEKAFRHVAFHDLKLYSQSIVLATDNYMTIAKNLKVSTGLEEKGPGPASDTSEQSR